MSKHQYHRRGHRRHDDHRNLNRGHLHQRAHRGVERTVLIFLSVMFALYASATLATYLAAPAAHSASTPGAPAGPPSALPGGGFGAGGVGASGRDGARSVRGEAAKGGRRDAERRLAERVEAATTTTTTEAAAVAARVDDSATDGSGAATPAPSPPSFPVTAIVPDEYETIVHPATEVLERMPNTANKAKPGPMRVPKFWAGPPGDGDAEFGGSYDAVRKYLGNYGERLMTREEALSVGSVVSTEEDAKAATAAGTNFGKERDESEVDTVETIFVMIASYRDWQCPQTVENLYGRARHPHRIRVAVVDQTSSEGEDVKCSEPSKPCDVDPTQALCRWRDRIDVFEMDSDLAVGPVFARHVGHRMYRGEYFALQIDAHVSFVRDWDADVIEQWKSAKNEMAVLTVYLHNDGDGRFDNEKGVALDKTRPIMCQTDYDGKGARRHLRHFAQPAGIPRIKGQPTIEPYWAAGFSFGRGHFVLNVPYDQHLPMIFQGEEISMTLRGFTYGYDFYTPERSVAFHSYAVGDNKEKRDNVHKYWEHTSLYAGSGTESFKRLNGMLGLNGPGVRPDPWLLHVDEKLYGIGHVRRLTKFFDTFGIHVESQTVEHHLCRFAGWTMHNMFTKRLRWDGMGIDYDRIDYRFEDPAPNDPRGLPKAQT